MVRKIIGSAVACGVLAVFAFASAPVSADDVNSGGGSQHCQPSYGGGEWGGWGPCFGDKFGIGMGYRQGYGAYCNPGKYGYGLAYPACGYRYGCAYRRSGKGVTKFW
jgi:hypothetical protein